MSCRLVAALVVALVLGAAPSAAVAAWSPFTPGAPGIGDPYFPLDGNGGYDVRHYELDLTYDPGSDMLRGRATIRARATQKLSRFNLDLVGMTVRTVRVGGRRAGWTRAGDELTVVPRRGLRGQRRFVVTVDYDGVPQTLTDGSGFIHTDDGTLVAGQPHGAATWFPVNDHPRDTAAYTFRVTVPAGLEVVANGELDGVRTRRGASTWSWSAREPLAPYLTTLDVGAFDLGSYRRDGIRYWDAIDPDLFASPTPRSGRRFAISQAANAGYKRLARTFAVPAAGGELSFWIRRDTEPDWDHVLVEARPAGGEEWTTLPDANGHTSPDTGLSCPSWLRLHPFLAHYQTEQRAAPCLPTGTSGSWSAASGASHGYEQWRVDLGAYAGRQVEVAIAYVSDGVIQSHGVVVDDIAGPAGQGTTSFEDDGDTLDGWTVPGAPDGSPANENDWIVGGAADTPPSTGEIARRAFARQPEIIAFLAGLYGPYPFSAAGGIVDDQPGLGFALETQTRPVYALEWFSDPTDPGHSVVVHELAHQWVGDSLALDTWRDIWLNEGFATYTEWLFAEREGQGTAQERFDRYAGLPASSPFWSVVIGDPGAGLLFDRAVYVRGAMTLHALRNAIGDRPFFALLRAWTQGRAGDNVRIEQFIALAEQIANRQLDGFFDAWLFSGTKPAGIGAAGARRAPLEQLPERGLLKR